MIDMIVIFWTFVIAFLVISILVTISLTLMGYFDDVWESTEPTGAKAVIYENDKGAVVEKNTSRGWMDISRIHSLDTLFSSPGTLSDIRFRVSKNGEVVDIQSKFGVTYVEKSGIEVDAARHHLVQFNITKVTVVEMESKRGLRSKGTVRKLLGQSTGNQIVVEYEITNIDDVNRHTTTKEMLQQLVTPTKGYRQ